LGTGKTNPECIILFKPEWLCFQRLKNAADLVFIKRLTFNLTDWE
jgi:hypothetical protein